MTNQIYSIPPDLVIGQEVASPSIFWHLPADHWAKIWETVTGKRIAVAVLDTGYAPHPDLPKPVSERSFIRNESVKDGNGHGTHCAGTVLGRDGIGVAPQADLIVGKVLSNSGSGSTDGIAQATRWAVDEGAHVISMSIGGGGFYSPMQSALEYAWSKGVITVAAAGNSGFRGSNTINFPGKYLETVCVGAFQRNGQISSFSSGGREIDVACPGQDIVSASIRGGYVSMSGTSMATPFMAGVMALIIQLQKQKGFSEFRTIDLLRVFLGQYSDDAGAPGKDDRFGFGIPNSQKITDALAAKNLTFV